MLSWGAYKGREPIKELVIRCLVGKDKIGLNCNIKIGVGVMDFEGNEIRRGSSRLAVLVGTM